MTLVVDASVFVAASRMAEEQYASSEEFLSTVAVLNHPLRCPSLVLPECAAAIMRATGNASAASEIVQQITAALSVDFVPLDGLAANSAVEAAIRCRTRGADSCYIALAAQSGAILITWDREMLERGSAIVQAMTPEQWLVEQNRPAPGG